MERRTNVLKSVDKAFKILEHLRDAGGATVTEVASALDMPKSTVQVYLNSLRESGFVVADDGTYGIGLQFLEYGFHALRDQHVFPAVKDKIEELADETGELAACFVEESGDGVYIYGREGANSIRTDLSMGDRTGLHCTANGKAILAYLPPDRVDQIVEEKGLPAMTEHTITEEDVLRAELETIREQGYATTREESIAGMAAVAAPILAGGHVAGTISLAGPASRFVGERFETDLPQLVKGAATEVETVLTYPESGF